MSSRKNPIDQAKDLLIEALKDPKSAAGTAVGTARETAAIGKMMAGQLSRFAVSEAGGLAGELLSRVAGPCGSLRQSTTAEPTVSGPIAVPDPDAPEPTAAADPAETAADAPAEKAAKKTAKKPAKKPAKKAAAKKATKKAAAKTESGSDMPTPADIAENVAPATKAAAKKSAASTRTTKAAETGTSSGSPAEASLPRADADVRDNADVDVTTPVVTSAAEATNPDTDEPDLEQPDTPPLMDPGTVHAVQSEADILRKAADPNKG